MRSIVYLLVMGLKNRLLDVVRKPAKLIMYLLLLAFIIFIFVLPMITGIGAVWENPTDMVWLKGIIFAFILLFFILAIVKGLQSGDVIFDMSDVNLLFVSPVNPRTILLYGVIRMMAISFWAGFFILFQGGSLYMFGIGFSGVLVIFAGFILAVSLMQVVSLLIYSLTNGNPKRKLVVQIITAAVFLPMAVEGIRQITGNDGDIMKALEALLRSPMTAWMPVAGWVSQGTVAFLSGGISTGFLFLTVTATVEAALITYIFFSNPDYYEDVLVATETTFEKKRALAEGKINTWDASGKKVKVAATGIGGAGGSAIFYKHLRESFRANKLGLWGLPSILIIAGSSLFAVMMGRLIGSTESNLLILLQTLMWMQLFLIGMGRGMTELHLHFIYMIPESPFTKIIWSNIETVLKVFVESLFIFGISGVILRESLLLIAASVSVYVLFTLLLIGVNYLFLRWTSAQMTAGLLIFIYVMAVIAIMLPGLVPAIIVGVRIEGWGAQAALGILAAWELLASLVCFALSKDILHRCDMSVMKIGR